MSDYIDYDEYLAQILNEVGARLSGRQQAEVREYYERHNEYGLAVEQLICALADEGIRISVSAKKMLSDMSRKMELEEGFRKALDGIEVERG